MLSGLVMVPSFIPKSGQYLQSFPVNDRFVMLFGLLHIQYNLQNAAFGKDCYTGFYQDSFGGSNVAWHVMFLFWKFQISRRFIFCF